MRLKNLKTLNGLIIAAACIGWAGMAVAADSDGDGIDDAADNCTAIANAEQIDSDGDGYGNRCDGDYNNDGSVDAADFAIVHNAFGAVEGEGDYLPAADHDSDGVIAGSDLSAHHGFNGQPVGPSALR